MKNLKSEVKAIPKIDVLVAYTSTVENNKKDKANTASTFSKGISYTWKKKQYLCLGSTKSFWMGQQKQRESNRYIDDAHNL